MTLPPKGLITPSPTSPQCKAFGDNSDDIVNKQDTEGCEEGRGVIPLAVSYAILVLFINN